MEIGAMDGGVTSGRPAGAQGEQGLVIDLADPQLTGALLDLRVAFQAEIGVSFREHLRVHRAMGTMAGDAAFAVGFVFKDKRAGLFAVALAALLVQAGHAESAGGLEDLPAVRVMALDAVHLAFRYWMMLGKPELKLDVQMTVVTGLGILAGVEDESGPVAWRRGMEASGAVAAFATGTARELFDVGANPKMDIALERP